MLSIVQAENTGWYSCNPKWTGASLFAWSFDDLIGSSMGNQGDEAAMFEIVYRSLINMAILNHDNMMSSYLELKNEKKLQFVRNGMSIS